MLGRQVDELQNLIELPDSCRHVWYWFNELSNTRSEGFNGALPITFTEIKSYFDLQKLEPQDWEVQLLKRLDIAYINHLRSKQAK